MLASAHGLICHLGGGLGDLYGSFPTEDIL